MTERICNNCKVDLVEHVKKLREENEELKAQIIQERDLHTQASKNYLQTIKELKAQIEKMKCCFNCKHYNFNYKEELECDLEFIDCKNHNEWELAK